MVEQQLNIINENGEIEMKKLSEVMRKSHA
jgi:hypothetical protein